MSDNTSAAIRVAGVRKSFGSTEVLRGIDLEFEAGSLACLLGPSGCGKTTLLRLIAGLDSPDSGRVLIDGQPIVDVDAGVFVRPERRGLGMVFQHYALWPHLTVLQNIAYPLKRHGVPRSQRFGLVSAAAAMVGLDSMLEHYPHQLSGGQQQRVALARAMVNEPRVVLLDEPLSNLDATLRKQLRRELRRLHERLGSTMIHVTHDQEEAAAIADVVVVMNGGKVVQQGRPGDILNAPNSRFVAEFVGFDTFITGELAECRGRSALVRLNGTGPVRTRIVESRPAGSKVQIALRSREIVVLGSAEAAPGDTSAIPGLVQRVSPVGEGADVEIQCGTELVEVRVDSPVDERPRAGDTVWLGFDPERVLAVEAPIPNTTQPS